MLYIPVHFIISFLHTINEKIKLLSYIIEHVSNMYKKN